MSAIALRDGGIKQHFHLGILMTNNAMARYEVLFVTLPSLTNDEASTIETQFRELLSANKCKALSYEKWGKYKLSYEIRKNEYGNYFLSRFEVPSVESGKTVEQLRNFFAVKYSETVLRNMFTHLSTNAPLEYKRPESMEEAPARLAREDGRRGDDEGFERRRGPGRGGRERRFETAPETTVEAQEDTEV